MTNEEIDRYMAGEIGALRRQYPTLLRDAVWERVNAALAAIVPDIDAENHQETMDIVKALAALATLRFTHRLDVPGEQRPRGKPD